MKLFFIASHNWVSCNTRLSSKVREENDKAQREFFIIFLEKKMSMLTTLYKNPTIVKVAFPTSRKSSFYKYFGRDVEKGDTVVVLTPNNGYVTATVKCVNSFDGLEAAKNPYELKWVVQKVDKRMYKRLLELDEERKCSVTGEDEGPVFCNGLQCGFYQKRHMHRCEGCKRET